MPDSRLRDHGLQGHRLYPAAEHQCVDPAGASAASGGASATTVTRSLRGPKAASLFPLGMSVGHTNCRRLPGSAASRISAKWPSSASVLLKASSMSFRRALSVLGQCASKSASSQRQYIARLMAIVKPNGFISDSGLLLPIGLHFSSP